MTLEDFKDVYKDAPLLTKLNLLMEVQSRRADAQAIAATERWNENAEAERHWVNEHRSASAKAIWLFEELKKALKAQEPRVMTPTEAYTADFVYVEFDGVITPALRTSNEREGHRESYFATQQLGGEWMRWDDYGITWRCWTSRPTKEQMEATAWKT